METCLPPRRRAPFPLPPNGLPGLPPPNLPQMPLGLLGGQRGQGPLLRSSPMHSEARLPWWKAWMRKYVILCFLCGGLSVLLGVIFVIIYFILRSYTTSLQFFETIPTYIPAVVLIITGLTVMCFAKRRNRYTYLIKLAGGFCLICALLCVVITVTTTVVHMNRLQMLHECIYTPKAKTCVCISAIADPNAQDGTHRFIFNNTPNCEVVHGSLFACLRTLFGLSVIGILVCIFSSMLVYQLLTHEKKKTYWEQLELRRRFLYRRYPNHGYCSCCEEFYPWQFWDMLDYRLLNLQRPLSPSMDHDDLSPTSTVELSSSMAERPDTGPPQGIAAGVQRSSGWNWLPWPWHGANAASHQMPNSGHPRENVNLAPNNSARRDSLLNRIMGRDGWNHLIANSALPTSPRDGGGPGTDPESSTSSPFQNECLHMFRTNSSSRNGGGGPIRFGGVRSRGGGGAGGPNGYRRHPQHWHRRTRSNDGVFHHLHLAAGPSGRCIGQPLGNNEGSNFFLGYELPRYMWGPPPPYSHPPSTENLTVERDRSGGGNHGGGNEPCVSLRPGDLNLPPPVPPRDSSELLSSGSAHSEKSTPMSQRRLMCHDFAGEGIRLTISGHYPTLQSNYGDVRGGNTILVGDENGHHHEEHCVVEVHVPYLFNKQEVIFNTLPARSSKKREPNPFKSLSNIPLCLSRRLNSLKQDRRAGHNRLSVIDTCFELKEILDCSIEDLPSRVNNNNRHAKIVLTQESPTKTLSEIKSESQGEYSKVNSEFSDLPAQPSSAAGFPATILELPSDFRSSVVIATSPSTPVTENVTLSDMMYAQSMPNLSVPNSPAVRRIRKIPSSGNTSTSQDFADFELDEDSAPILVASPECDILSVTSLPDDNEPDNNAYANKTASPKKEMMMEEYNSAAETPVAPTPPLRRQSCVCQNCIDRAEFARRNRGTTHGDRRYFRKFSRRRDSSMRDGGSSSTASESLSDSLPSGARNDFVITIKSINV